MVSYLQDRQALVKDIKHLTNVCVSYGKVLPRKSPHVTNLQGRTDNEGIYVSQPIVHWGFVPFIIVLGMTTTEPRPSFAQLLAPV